MPIHMCEAEKIWGKDTERCRHEEDAGLCIRCFRELAENHGWTEDFLDGRLEQYARYAESNGCSDHAAAIRQMRKERRSDDNTAS